MPSRLKGLTKAFGVLDGMKLYCHVKVKPFGWLYSNRYGTRFYLRSHSSDWFTFDQVFIRHQYNIKLPFIPKTIIDAGANIGLSAAYFAYRFPNSEIIALEPNKENFDVLTKNISNFKKIRSLRSGLWNTDTYLELINTNSAQNAFMVTETTAVNINAIPAVSIKTLMLQNDWSTIDLLKIDIEGSEKEVFEANTEYWLPKTKAIFIETHDKMKKGSSKAVFKAISQYDFSFSMNDENLVFINENYSNNNLD